MIAKTNESEMVIYMKNGSIIQLKGADDPDALRGAGPVGMILDEFATMRSDVWQVVEPILRANGGWAWFVGTPKGRNHLYDFYLRGLAQEGEWKSFLLKASESGIIPEKELIESRKTLAGAMFNQEFECEFLEGAGQVFRGVRGAANATPKPPEVGHLYVMGVDLAKVQDWTVITVYDRSTNQQVYQDRFQKLEWPFQKRKIQMVSQHYNNALVVVDATGLGDPIADDLARSGVPIEPFKITEPSKKEMIEKLSVYIEQRLISIIPKEETFFEFDNFSYKMSQSGKIHYSAPDGLHDDIVMSHALCMTQLFPTVAPQREISLTPIQSMYNESKRDYANTFNDGWGGWEEADF